MLKKILATLGSVPGCHIPIGILVLGKCLLSPVGFWQTFVFYGVGAYFLGGLQIACWILLVWLLWMIWSN